MKDVAYRRRLEFIAKEWLAVSVRSAKYQTSVAKVVCPRHEILVMLYHSVTSYYYDYARANLEQLEAGDC